MKFNEVTWYSKLAAAIFFLIIYPALVFYIGTQYQTVKDVPSEVGNQNNPIHPAATIPNQN